MTTEFLIKASKIIESGLRMPTKPEEEPCPEQPDLEWNSTVGRLEPKPEPDRCVWCCPTTCLNCGIENCEDRLAGGNVEIP